MLIDMEIGEIGPLLGYEDVEGHGSSPGRLRAAAAAGYPHGPDLRLPGIWPFPYIRFN